MAHLWRAATVDAASPSAHGSHQTPARVHRGRQAERHRPLPDPASACPTAARAGLPARARHSCANLHLQIASPDAAYEPVAPFLNARALPDLRTGWAERLHVEAGFGQSAFF